MVATSDTAQRRVSGVWQTLSLLSSSIIVSSFHGLQDWESGSKCLIKPVNEFPSPPRLPNVSMHQKPSFLFLLFSCFFLSHSPRSEPWFALSFCRLIVFHFQYHSYFRAAFCTTVNCDFPIQFLGWPCWTIPISDDHFCPKSSRQSSSLIYSDKYCQSFGPLESMKYHMYPLPHFIDSGQFSSPEFPSFLRCSCIFQNSTPMKTTFTK